MATVVAVPHGLAITALTDLWA
eukprot:SAG31_NODE_45677_length_258_cov_0.572327_1_plen_21_part_10